MDNAIIEAGPEVLASANMLHEWADMVIENVRSQSDDRLVELARDAQNLEKAAFRVRGACGAELKRRIMERRLTGQDGSTAENSIGKQMNALAKEIGIAPKTLSDDTRIYETFGDDLNGEIKLDREHYRMALSAPDPKAAIELAKDNRENDSGYSTRDFRDDVRKLQAIETPDGDQKGKSQSIKLGAEALKALDELRKTHEFLDLDNNEIITHALVDLLVRTANA